MRITSKRATLAAALAIGTAIPVAWAAGMWQTLPIIGGAAYCASSIGVGPVQTTQTGTGAGTASANQTTGNVICQNTVPAGPSTFSGTEMLPLDLYTPGTAQQVGGPSTALVNIQQLGQGPMTDVTSPVSATIPANTPFYFLDGAQASAFTITMPAVAVEGQIQRIVCEAATVGALTVAANSGQTLKGNPSTACVAGVGYAWRYQASNTTWYRFQ